MNDYALLNAMVRRHKGALTRAKKKGPEAVLKCVELAYADFDKGLWPDNWHLWEIAKSDAEMEKRYNQWRWIPPIPYDPEDQ